MLTCGCDEGLVSVRLVRDGGDEEVTTLPGPGERIEGEHHHQADGGGGQQPQRQHARGHREVYLIYFLGVSLTLKLDLFLVWCLNLRLRLTGVNDTMRKFIVTHHVSARR